MAVQGQTVINSRYSRIDDLCQGRRGSVSAVCGPWRRSAKQGTHYVRLTQTNLGDYGNAMGDTDK